MHSLMIGSNFADDTKNGFFLTVNDQIDIACKKIAADPKLQNGFAYVTFFGINFFLFFSLCDNVFYAVFSIHTNM